MTKWSKIPPTEPGLYFVQITDFYSSEWGAELIERIIEIWEVIKLKDKLIYLEFGSHQPRFLTQGDNLKWWLVPIILPPKEECFERKKN